MPALIPSSIINRAAKQLGSSMSVANWQTDLSTVASTARTYYQETLEEILRDFDWPFARVQQKLALLVEGYSFERRFAYAYPPGCACIRRVFNPYGKNRNDDERSAQRWIIADIPNPPLPLTPIGDGLGNIPYPPGSTHPPQTPYTAPTSPQTMVKAILADHPYLCVEFTAMPPTITDFPQDFQMAFVFKLAHYMAPSLTGGDPYKVGDRAAALYAQAIQTAAMHAYNEEQTDQPRPGEFVGVRRMPEGHMGDVIEGGIGPSGFEIA